MNILRLFLLLSLSAAFAAAQSRRDCEIGDATKHGKSYSKACTNYCKAQSTCETCAPTTGNEVSCAWCESTLTCGPWDGQDDAHGGTVNKDPNQSKIPGSFDPSWTCPTFGAGKATVFLGKSYQCSGESGSGPMIMQAKPDEPTADLNAISTDGDFGGITFAMEHVGEVACTLNKDCPVLAAGPFNCSVYKTASFTLPTGAAGNLGVSTYTCSKMPGLGRGNTFRVWVRGMPESVFSEAAVSAGYHPTNRTLNYAPPTIATVTNPDGSQCVPPGVHNCSGSTGKNLTITGTNFPADEASTAAWKSANGGREAFLFTLGGHPCFASGYMSSTQAFCTIPAANGINQPLQLTVGGQPDAGKYAGKITFDYNPPQICGSSNLACAAGVVGVTPAKGPSFGGVDVTITGASFGTVMGSVQVMFESTETASLKQECVVKSLSDTTIVCTSPKSGTKDEQAFTVVVTAGGQSTTQSGPNFQFTAAACSAQCSGSNMACVPDGDCLCGGNFLAGYDTQTSQRTCTCPEGAATSLCQGGSTFTGETTCTCTCRADPQHWQPTPAPAPDASNNPGTLEPPATCNACTVPCSGALQKSAPDASGKDCTCSFNPVHIVWIVFLALAVIAGAGAGYWYYKKQKNTGDLYDHQGTKYENMDDSDRESGRVSQPSGTNYF